VLDRDPCWPLRLYERLSDATDLNPTSEQIGPGGFVLIAPQNRVFEFATEGFVMRG